MMTAVLAVLFVALLMLSLAACGLFTEDKES